MAEMKTRAAAALTAVGLACGGLAINDGVAGAVSTASAVAASDDGTVQTNAYKLRFVDNFTGSKLNPVWQFRNVQAPQRLCSRLDPRLATVKNGKLRLQVRRDASRKPNVTKACPDGQFLNAMIGTDGTKTFQYGKFSARLKFHQPKGAHGSFWLQSPGTEVDTIEYFGRAGTPGGGLRSYVHRPKVVNGQTTFVTSGGAIKARRIQEIMGRTARPSDAFHTYTVVWTPSSYVFSIDGKVTLKVTDAVSSTPVALVLSLLSSYYELPYIKNRDLPITMQVDWVKVWQK
jgi:beta-glucanase (GH16 family)